VTDYKVKNSNKGVAPNRLRAPRASSAPLGSYFMVNDAFDENEGG
jgi:hypothetical protein